VSTRDSNRLMIVEDDKTLLQALCTALTAEGFNVKGFSSPRQALDALQPGAFDLIVTDLKMPEMDGISLISAARQVDVDLGAIVMTGYGTVETAAQAMQGGALDYVLKPIKLHVVLPVIRRALDVKRLQYENALLSRELAAVYQDIERGVKSSLRSIEDVARTLEDEFADKLGLEGQRLAEIIRRSVDNLGGLIAALLQRKRQT
jgi:two-component system sensor histidine kinase/response regulator